METLNRILERFKAETIAADLKIIFILARIVSYLFCVVKFLTVFVRVAIIT